tara:strand:- start:86 stop:577 length:492 start_codon:yes stop_codon:yes gene_type:complete
MSNKIIDIQKNFKTNDNFNNLNPILFEHNFQIKCINNIYFDISFQYKDLFCKEIKKKINGYKSQDKKKFINNDYNNINLISFNDIVEKLVKSKLSCYYCSNKIFIIYKFIRDDNQFTLDRLNNCDIHTNNNTIVSCYKCNIKRRNQNSEKFKLSKNLINIKKI